MITNKKTTRIAGFGYLIIILASAFAKVLIRYTIIVPGDYQTGDNSVMVSE